MKLKLTAVFVVGLALGFMGRSLLPMEQTLAEHWRIVEEYRAFALDPSNYSPDPQTGFSVADPPNDPRPSLAALVAAGELNHVDIVLPTVPCKNREANRFWMQFLPEHDGVIHALGNSTYAAFTTAGEQPLHLNIWFKDSAEPVVRELISKLEEMGRGEQTTTP